jgi:hypothetical protein
MLLDLALIAAGAALVYIGAIGSWQSVIETLQGKAGNTQGAGA